MIFRLLLGAFLFSGLVFAESVSHRVSSSNVSVGTVVSYEMELMYPKSFRLLEVPEPYNLPSLSVKDVTQTKEEVQGKWYLRRAYDIQVFSVEDVVLPTASVSFQVDGALETYTLPAITLTNRSLLEEGAQLNLEVALKPIKIDWVPYIWRSVLGLIACCLLAFLVYKLVKRFKGSEAMEALPVEPELPPKEWIAKRLATLEALGLIEAGAFTDFYLQLTESLKIFLSRVFKVQYVDCTTEELAALLKPRLSEDLYVRLMKLFQESDQIKFAKAVPSRETHDQRMAQVRALIEELPDGI